jgi:putative hemolysin
MTPRHGRGMDQEWMLRPTVSARFARTAAAGTLVCGETIDDVVGVVEPGELLQWMLGGRPLDLQALIRQPLYVPSSMAVLRVLETIRRAGQQAAVVLDEYGGVEGLIAFADIMDEVVRDLAGKEATAESLIVPREDGSLLVDGLTPIQDLEALLNLEPAETEERRGYQTVAGFVMARLGRIPRIAEHFEWARHRFEVVDMDRHRVDRVLVTPPAHPTEPAG